MATFKDIAELAGVSYGTVSNVFGNRGNVSSDKIKRVHQAAAQLGYTPNQNAQLLRKSSSNILAVIIPYLTDRQYTDFYTSFRFFAESMGYRTVLYLSDGSALREEMLLTEIKSTQPVGLAVISTLSGTEDPYMQIGFAEKDVLFVEQRPFLNYDYLGFDYRKIGMEMGEKASAYDNVALITEKDSSYVSQEIRTGFLSSSGKCRVQLYEKNAVNSATLAFDILSARPAYDAVFSVIVNHADMIQQVYGSFYDGKKPELYTISPLYTVPENSFHKYELNYRLLGRTAAEKLIRNVSDTAYTGINPQIIKSSGFRKWIPSPIPEEGSLTMLTLDSPTAYIVKNMARMYTKNTGVPIKVAVFPYDGIHKLLTELDQDTPFDIIRLDATWMSRFAAEIFEPLQQIDPFVGKLESDFLPGLLERYGGYSETIYALPETPSNQMLFYRRDLFENAQIRRIYQEQNHSTLRPPQSFEEYNRIARFFTRTFNPESPTSYGSTLTLGNTGVAATEFLTRYFALTDDLFDMEDRILLDSANGRQAMAELVQSSEYTRPGYSAWWRDTARFFAAGDTAMTILYSNYASEMLNRNSKVRGNIGYAMVPGENPMYGGGSIGVCRYSKKKKLAYHFIRWLCSETVSTAMTLLGSVSPCRDTYDNYQVIDTYPWLSMSAECLMKSNVHRFPHAKGNRFDERRFLAILGMQVINAINGSCTVEEALNNAVQQFYTRD